MVLVLLSSPAVLLLPSLLFNLTSFRKISTMAAALVLGNLTLLADASSPRVPSSDRPKPRLTEAAAAPVGRPRRDHHPFLLSAAKGFHESSAADGTGESARRRRCTNSKVGAVSGGGGGGGEGYDWEEELRSRLKEMEEMKELEKRAEELQRRVTEEGDGEETEEEKRERVRRELEKVAKEQAERRETAKLMFELGQKAYGKGMYARSIEFLEASLTIIPRPTLLGGEIQIWLAMAYEANNRHRDCIALYQQLEKKHPSVSIRRQAAELRYILQAPKLKISKDEMVTIPLIGSSYDRYAGTWSDKYKDRDMRTKMTTTNQLPSSRDFLGDFLVWRPPSEWEKSRAFWVIVTLWFCLIGTALLLQRF